MQPKNRQPGEQLPRFAVGARQSFDSEVLRRDGLPFVFLTGIRHGAGPAKALLLERDREVVKRVGLLPSL